MKNLQNKNTGHYFTSKIGRYVKEKTIMKTSDFFYSYFENGGTSREFFLDKFVLFHLFLLYQGKLRFRSLISFYCRDLLFIKFQITGWL